MKTPIGCDECSRRGYFASHSDKYGWEIERCDMCQSFDDDDEAWAFFTKGLRGGDSYAYEQLELIR